jgi:hypothetical protein
VGEADVGEDLEVVGPCGVGEEGEALGVGVVELCEEEGAEVKSAGTGDGLQAGDALVLDGRAIGAENELLGGGGVVGQTGDRQVLVVEVGVFAQDLVGLWRGTSQLCGSGCVVAAECTHLLDDGQDPGLCVVVAVGPNAQVDLALVLVCAEGAHEAEEGILGCLGDDAGVESGGSHWSDV